MELTLFVPRNGTWTDAPNGITVSETGCTGPILSAEKAERIMVLDVPVESNEVIDIISLAAFVSNP